MADKNMTFIPVFYSKYQTVISLEAEIGGSREEIVMINLSPVRFYKAGHAAITRFSQLL